MNERFSRKQLLSSPVREWDKTSEYDAILLVPTGGKHDSGYAIVAIVGLTGEGEARTVEIAGYADDINWHIEPKTDEYRANLRNDCYYPSGIMHFWSEGKLRFRVGHALSSTSIYVTGGGK